MNTIIVLRSGIIATLALLLFSPTGIAQTQNTTQFTVTLTGQSLTAGFNNTLTMVVTYSYSSPSIYPSGTVYDVDLALTVPVPLQMFRDNHWHYDSLALGQPVTVDFEVYAPTTAIGNSYQGSVTLTYRALGDISYTQESHDVSFSVHGWISLVLYGVQLTPVSAPPGGNATISGNVLNGGNLAAYNANVTVESEALAPGTATSVFLGEVDPNIPRPFSLLLNFRKNLVEGNYSIVVKVSAIDTNMPASPYSAQQASRVQIKRPVTQPPTEPQRGGGGLVGMILEILRSLWSLFFGPSSLPTLAYSYFSPTTAYNLDALHAG